MASAAQLNVDRLRSLVMQYLIWHQFQIDDSKNNLPFYYILFLFHNTMRKVYGLSSTMLNEAICTLFSISLSQLDKGMPFDGQWKWFFLLLLFYICSSGYLEHSLPHAVPKLLKYPPVYLNYKQTNNLKCPQTLHLLQANSHSGNSSRSFLDQHQQW